jgi:AcrR family transcriptional regulator
MRTHRVDRIVRALIEARTIEEAAQRAGVSRATLYRYLSRAEVREKVEALREQQQQLLLMQLTQLHAKSLERISELLDSEDERIRLQACRELLRLLRPPSDREVLVLE